MLLLQSHLLLVGVVIIAVTVSGTVGWTASLHRLGGTRNYCRNHRASSSSSPSVLLWSTTPESLFGDLDEVGGGGTAAAGAAAAAAAAASTKEKLDKPSSPPPSPTTTTSSFSDSSSNDDDEFPTYDSVDWVALNPLAGLSWEEYEQRYVYNTDGSTPPEELEWDPTVPTLNQLYVVGRVGNVGEPRYLGGSLSASGSSSDGGEVGNVNDSSTSVVVQLSIALPRYYNYWERADLGVKYGEEETEWYNCEVWGQTAEFVAKNVQKGMRVGIIGAIDTDFYENRRPEAAGMLSTNCKVLVQDLDILESKTEAEIRKESQRGPSFYTGGDDDDDTYNPMSGSSGGFFDPS